MCSFTRPLTSVKLMLNTQALDVSLLALKNMLSLMRDESRDMFDRKGPTHWSLCLSGMEGCICKLHLKEPQFRRTLESCHCDAVFKWRRMQPQKKLEQSNLSYPSVLTGNGFRLWPIDSPSLVKIGLIALHHPKKSLTKKSTHKQTEKHTRVKKQLPWWRRLRWW